MTDISQQLHKVPPELRDRYLANLPLINAFRKRGQELREQVRQNPVRNGYLLTREMHPVEVEVVEKLCPAIRSARGKERTKAWKWVMRQDWGKDFRASPYEQRYF